MRTGHAKIWLMRITRSGEECWSIFAPHALISAVSGSRISNRLACQMVLTNRDLPYEVAPLKREKPGESVRAVAGEVEDSSQDTQ